MSDTAAAAAADPGTTNGATNALRPFPSLPALHTNHLDLVRRQRESGTPADFLSDVSMFIQRGAATGVLLDSEADRETAQGLLDYWATIFYRAGYEPPDATLAEFDPSLAPLLDDSLCPYVGLDAFREGDHAIFFGRQRTVQEIVALLVQHRLIAVIGPSGSGKSSVVRAGVIPALRDGALPGSEQWHAYPPMVPGAMPLMSLARLLAPPHVDPDWVERQQAGFRADSGHLAKLIADIQATTVICVDQFEEVFTLCEDEHERDAFIENLLYLIDQPGAQHSIILTMRSDFETFVAREPALQERFADGRVPVTPLSAAELREAIERPAIKIGLKFEDGVVELLLHDLLGEPAALPLLQFTLLKLWENRARNRVTKEAYQRLGGGRLALARSADEFYANLIPEEQVTARRILLRMIRPGEGLEVTSNRIRRAALYRATEANDRIDRVLEKLIQARLVRVSGGDTPEDEQIEVAHEALVRNWPTLVDWLEDERSALSVRRRLEAKAAEWVRLGRGNSGLLDREQLIEAEHWLASYEAEYLGFDPTLPELVVFSRAAIEEAEQEQEQIRQRELQQARALAEEQQRRAEAERKRAETEAASNRRLTVLFRALALAAMLLVAAAVWAITQQQAAQSASAIAQAERITAEAARATADAARGTAISQAVQLQTEVAKSSSSAATAQAEGTRADISAATAQAAQGDAERQQRLDRANLLAAVSGALAQSQPQLSVLMAVESARVNTDLQQAPSITATNALTQTLIGFGATERGLWPQQGPITAVALSADGGRAISGSDQGAVWLWNLRDPQSTGVALEGFTHPITKVAITPDGKWAIAGDNDGSVRVWDADNPGTAPRELPKAAGAIHSLLVSANGQRLVVSGSQDTSVRIWNLANLATAPLTLSRHTKPVTSVALSGDGNFLLTGGADSVTLLWNLSARNPASSASNLNARPEQTPLTQVALSANTTQAVTVAADGIAHGWSVSGGQFEGRPTVTPVGTNIALAIDPQGRWIVIGNPNGTIDLRRFPGTSLDVSLRGHTGAITALAFNNNGSRLISSSADGTVRVWDISRGTPPALLRVLRGHEGAVNVIAFSDDGGRLVSAGNDQSIREWNLADPAPSVANLPTDPAALATLACRFAGRDMTTAEWQQYYDGKSYRKTCGS